MQAQLAFQDLLTDTNNLHGWQIPRHVTLYQSSILAQRLAQPNWRPEPSFAERYFTVRSSSEALEFANTCWFARAVFPELGQRHINASYYVDLGQTCYDRVIQAQQCPSPTINAMRDHFEFLAEACWTAIRHYGDFRSMWD